MATLEVSKRKRRDHKNVATWKKKRSIQETNGILREPKCGYFKKTIHTTKCGFNLNSYNVRNRYHHISLADMLGCYLPGNYW
jgi:hypothetical protein